MMKKLLLTLIILLSILPFSCNEDKIDLVLFGSLTGEVILDIDGKPLEGVEVSTAPATSVLITDSTGTFQFDKIPTGEYIISASLEGYEKSSLKVTVNESATSNVSLKLSRDESQPSTPMSPVPANNDTNQTLSVSLQWSVENPSDDELTYHVNLYESNEELPFVNGESLEDTTMMVEGLKYNTVYFWQVSVVSSAGTITNGEVWNFSTLPFPDNRLLFSSKRSGNYELYASDSLGDSLVRLTDTHFFELYPRYTANRDLIAFASNENIDYHIYTMEKNGGGRKKVTSLPIAGFHNQGLGFSWSPDYGRFIYSNYNKLYSIDKDGTDLQLVALAPADRNFRGCDWTAQGDKIIVETVGEEVFNSELYIMEADGTDMTLLVDNLPGVMGSPSFSIDGNTVLFTNDISGLNATDGRQLDSHIFLMDLNTMALTDISTNKVDGTNDLNPRYSPDGAKIIFENVANDLSEDKSIWIMDLNGSNRELVFDSAEMPDWK